MPLTGAIIAQLILELGPKAIVAIQSIIETWSKELTVPEALAILEPILKKTTDDYLEAAGAVSRPTS